MINSIFIKLLLLSKHLNKFLIKGAKFDMSLKNIGSDKFIFSMVIKNPDNIKLSLGTSLFLLISSMN